MNFEDLLRAHEKELANLKRQAALVDMCIADLDPQLMREVIRETTTRIRNEASSVRLEFSRRQENRAEGLETPLKSAFSRPRRKFTLSVTPAKLGSPPLFLCLRRVTCVKALFCEIMAERKGFEPSIRVIPV